MFIEAEVLGSLLLLIVLEIVLGIDNLVFIAILADRLPVQQRSRARRIGLSLALVTRVALLATIDWMMDLTRPIFTVGGHGISWRDVILIGGGLILFELPVSVYSNRPLTLDVYGAAGQKASTISLDL